MKVIKGIAVSPGVEIGQAFVLGEVEQHVPRRVIDLHTRDQEITRLETAVQDAIGDLDAMQVRTREELGGEASKIFEFHIGLLKDPTLLEPIHRQILDNGDNAEFALAEQFRTLVEQFKAMGTAVFRQKANDIIDLERRVLGKLMGETASRMEELQGPAIVISHELTPSEAAALDPNKIVAFATDAGGLTSHTSIVARALGIPAVVGCKNISYQVNDGEQLVIDGDTGQVVINPDDAAILEFQRQRELMSSYRMTLREGADLEAMTLDGTRIQILGNIEFPREVDAVLDNGGDGVGLYRTEYLYLTSPSEPTEDDHYRAYSDAIKRLDGKPLTIRTVDLGADKYTQERAEEPERNPFLGCRSIRYCLQNLPMFKTQLRAILRASSEGPVKVMFPLVSTIPELRQTRMILNDVMEELEEEGIDFDRELSIGIMIEVPSAALMARVFSEEVSFFSIGTNDLIQYTLAVDRGNERVANLYTGASPAVLTLIKSVLRAGRRSGIDTSICGEIAGEAAFTMLLLGLGLRTLSMVPTQIPEIKKVIRSVDMDTCERLARKVGSFDSESQVRTCLRDELRKINSDSPGGRATS